MNKNLQTLITYQAWRTGDDHAMPDPADISQALNWAIGELTCRATTDNTEVILRLEAELDRLQDLYRTEQSLHAATERHNAKLVDENAELVRLHGEAVEARRDAQRQIIEGRKERKWFDRQVTFAAMGLKHGSERGFAPLMDAIRGLHEKASPLEALE